MKRLTALIAPLALAACVTKPPGPPALVAPASFPVEVQPQQQVTDGSVFPVGASGSLYEPRRDWRVGNLVTINIVTSSTANNIDDASLKRTGKLSDAMTSFMGVPMSFGSINGGSLQPEISANSDQEYNGAGASTAANNINGQVEAVITNVDANGTLAIAGRTNVNINGNVISIVVTGYASPEDITANATISSNQVADMNVQYVGNGPINGAHDVPWLQQILNKVSPF